MLLGHRGHMGIVERCTCLLNFISIISHWDHTSSQNLKLSFNSRSRVWIGFNSRFCTLEAIGVFKVSNCWNHTLFNNFLWHLLSWLVRTIIGRITKLLKIYSGSFGIPTFNTTWCDLWPCCWHYFGGFSENQHVIACILDSLSWLLYIYVARTIVTKSCPLRRK